MRSLKYIKSGLSCLFAYQSRQSMSLDDGACHKHNLVGLARIFDGASPGPRAACLWVPVQSVGLKVSRVIIYTITMIKLKAPSFFNFDFLRLFSTF